MNKDEATMAALAHEVRLVFKNSNDAPRLFGEYFHDEIQQHIRPQLEERDDRIEQLEDEVQALKNELNDTDA